ncbi:hypothetical protein BB561_004127 [Smittium simulii]|uniref:Uncharacterized protein n=1 Tax=Smittium simulii TaxID=133385 RepID=A0A2T9YHY7_9FUNG|nr:hypothetical protein BB561_004127 [Smittium simulii]
MKQELIQLIKDLSDKVNILYNEREANSTHQEQEMKVQSSSGEDPYLRARAPMYEVENYPQLTEEFPDMEDDIFRSPLKDEERKEIVYGFPKFKAMNYLPPPLNDSTSTAVKKVDGLHIRDFSKPLSVDSISRIIKKVTSICVKEGSQIPKARAIGATLAASAGISADKIISHANWSGYSMFDNYYRLTRDSDVNITESIL